MSISDVMVPLRDLGLTLVTGHSYDEGSANGAGKSSLVRNSISWCLFGQTINGVRGDKIINRRTKKDCVVQLSFKTDRFYTIARGRNPNFLRIVSQGTDMSGKTEKQTQEVIEKVIGKDFNVFLHADLYGQGKKKIFMNLTPGEQKELIEGILPFHKLNEWLASTTQFLAQTDFEIRTLENKIIELNGNLQSTEETQNTLIKDSLKWESQRLFKIKELQDKILTLSNENKLAYEQKKTLLNRLGSIENPSRPKKILHLKENLHNENMSYSSLVTKSNLLKERVQNSSNLFKKFLEDRSKCTTCGQRIDSEISEDIEERLQLALYSNQSQMNKVNQDLESTSQQIKKLVDELKILERLEEKKKQYEDDLAKIHIVEPSEIEARIEELNDQTGPYQKSLETLTKNKEQLVSSIHSTRSVLAEKKTEKEHLEFWRKAYGKDIPIILFNRACPFLEERTNHYLGLLGNPQIRTQFHTIKELKSGDTRRDFNVSVESETGGEDFNLLSGGEQQMVNFAVCLALSDLINTQVATSSKFAILDEPFTNLDVKNCESVVNFLTTEFLEKRKTVLLISNEENLKRFIPNKINVIKRGGITSLGEG